MRRARIALVAFALLTACGRTSGTVEVPPEDLPFSVAREPTATGTPATTRDIRIFLARHDRLVPATREVDAQHSAVETAMRALLDGPTRPERARGIRTTLPRSVGLLGLSLAGETAYVDLSGEFQEPAAPDEIALRVAQVTWTLTDIFGVREVAFAIDGEAVAVTTGDGTSVQRPVRRSDYIRFAPAR